MRPECDQLARDHDSEEHARDGKKKPWLDFSSQGLRINSGGVLLSHAVTRAVPSALEGLTSEFGMGSGMTPPT